MNSDVVVIEKWIDNNSRLTIHYSECIKETTIKILRKSAPNVKWNINTTYKAKINYELLKTITQKFVFIPHPNVDEIIDYVEQQLRKIEKLEKEDS